MYTTAPPTLKTFSHWPSWLNAYGNLDRSACFELRVSQVRRLAGCIPLRKGQYGKWYQDSRKRPADMPDLPNERRARSFKGRISCGHYDITPMDLDWLARQQFPRRLAGDWRTGRAPAMRRSVQTQPLDHARTDEPAAADETAGQSQPLGRGSAAAWGMNLEQGGHGPGERAYERKLADHPPSQPLPAPASMQLGLPTDVLDAGLAGNPNRGASREKRFGLNFDWTQRLQMEKHHHASVSGKQYFLVCPGPVVPGADASPLGRGAASAYAPRWEHDAKRRRSSQGKANPCNRTAYKLFWVLARPAEHRDALLAEQWIASLTSSALARQSAEVSAMIDRYGPIMGDDRKLRCRLCLNMRYGKSPEASRKWRERKRRDLRNLAKDAAAWRSTEQIL